MKKKLHLLRNIGIAVFCFGLLGFAGDDDALIEKYKVVNTFFIIMGGGVAVVASAASRGGEAR